jgi:hypothetical protein
LNLIQQFKFGERAWKALHFTMRILKNGNSNTKRLAYTSLVCPTLEYGAVYWDPYREEQTNALDKCEVDRLHVYVLSSKRTLKNGLGKL